ncbi:MAG TPA: ribbon-helix-helix protein, CopG family [Thermoanaerobaculia bacterium]|nr:ribbon-helix-helix protein, CopG family [Thermoanaerobaculia bacterium]
MKSLTVRLPDAMAAEIESESIADGISKSDVVRRRLENVSARPATLFDLAADLIGSVDDARMPRDLSSRKKNYLKSKGYGKRGHR